MSTCFCYPVCQRHDTFSWFFPRRFFLGFNKVMFWGMSPYAVLYSAINMPFGMRRECWSYAWIQHLYIYTASLCWVEFTTTIYQDWYCPFSLWDRGSSWRQRAREKREIIVNNCSRRTIHYCICNRMLASPRVFIYIYIYRNQCMLIPFEKLMQHLDGIKLPGLIRRGKHVRWKYRLLQGWFVFPWCDWRVQNSITIQSSLNPTQSWVSVPNPGGRLG